MDGEAALSGKRGKIPMTAGGFSESSFMSRELYTDHVMTSSSGRVSCCSTELTCAIHNSSFILAPYTRLCDWNLADDASRYKHRIVTQLNWMYESIDDDEATGL